MLKKLNSYIGLFISMGTLLLAAPILDLNDIERYTPEISVMERTATSLVLSEINPLYSVAKAFSKADQRCRTFPQLSISDSACQKRNNYVPTEVFSEIQHLGLTQEEFEVIYPKGEFDENRASTFLRNLVKEKSMEITIKIYVANLATLLIAITFLINRRHVGATLTYLPFVAFPSFCRATIRLLSALHRKV